MDAESKNCWKSLVTKEMVSSEEEDMHGEEKIFSRVRKQNRPTKISDFFGELDTFANKRMSKKGKFRSMRRVVGEPKPETITFTTREKDAMRKLNISFD